MRKFSGPLLLAMLVVTVVSATQQQQSPGQPRTADEVRPFVGTWKQNIDKSFYSNPYSAVIRIESAGVNRVKITQEGFRTAGDYAAGKKELSVGEFILDGTETQPSGIPGLDGRLPETQSFRRINSNVWERIARRPGDIRRGFWAV